MSFTKATTLWCDWDNKKDNDICNDWFGQVSLPIEAIRKDAKHNGWTYKNGKDYCPTHSKGKTK